MRNILLASAAFMFVGASSAFAGVPALDVDPALSNAIQNNYLVFAKDGGDDSGSDDHGSSSGNDDHGGNSGNDDRSENDDDEDDGDDRGGVRGRDSDDDSSASGSNRRKPRVPGGSGCDSARDRAEHPECRAQ